MPANRKVGLELEFGMDGQTSRVPNSFPRYFGIDQLKFLNKKKVHTHQDMFTPKSGPEILMKYEYSTELQSQMIGP